MAALHCPPPPMPSYPSTLTCSRGSPPCLPCATSPRSPLAQADGVVQSQVVAVRDIRSGSAGARRRRAALPPITTSTSGTASDRPLAIRNGCQPQVAGQGGAGATEKRGERRRKRGRGARQDRGGRSANAARGAQPATDTPRGAGSARSRSRRYAAGGRSCRRQRHRSGSYRWSRWWFACGLRRSETMLVTANVTTRPMTIATSSSISVRPRCAARAKGW